MKCEQCNKEFEAKRSTAKYCSAKCRKLAFLPDAKVSVPELSVPGTMTPEGLKPEVPANYGQLDCECLHCRQFRNHKLNHGAYKDAGQLAEDELNRVSLPGDVDYVGVADSHPEWPRRAPASARTQAKGIDDTLIACLGSQKGIDCFIQGRVVGEAPPVG